MQAILNNVSPFVNPSWIYCLWSNWKRADDSHSKFSFVNFVFSCKNQATEVIFLIRILYVPSPLHYSISLFMNQSDSGRQLMHVSRINPLGQVINAMFNTRCEIFCANPLTFHWNRGISHSACANCSLWLLNYCKCAACTCAELWNYNPVNSLKLYSCEYLETIFLWIS